MSGRAFGGDEEAAGTNLPADGNGRDDARSDPVSRQLADLATLDLETLRQRWRRTFRKSAPPGLTRHLLIRILAYRIQVAAYGDLSRETKKILEAIARDGEASGGKGEVPPPPPLRSLLPGAILSREHDGVLHRVTVLEKGFAWNGSTYPSLSKVAHAITGTNWNGPRFFGLRDPRSRTVAAPDGANSVEARGVRGSATGTLRKASL